jgi:hypothetical protein
MHCNLCPTAPISIAGSQAAQNTVHTLNLADKKLAVTLD